MSQSPQATGQRFAQAFVLLLLRTDRKQSQPQNRAARDHVPCTAVDDTANDHGTGLRIYCTFYGYFRVYAPNLLKKTLCRKTGHHVRGGSLTPLVGTAALRDVVFPYA